MKALEEQGYVKPSPIQEKAIPPALAGRDVLGCAQTGTGKTCAFAAPILQRLGGRVPRPRAIRALILTPTRELAIQIQDSFVSYGRNLPLRSAVIFGGVGQQPQVDAIRRGLEPVVERICETWLRLKGYDERVSVDWLDVNLQDEESEARAELYRAQARAVEKENEDGNL